MINLDDEMLPDLSSSCTTDVAVAKMLGWMRGPLRRKYTLVTLDGVSADQLPFLYSLDVSLDEQLLELLEAAKNALNKAAEADASAEALQELAGVVLDREELIKKAASYKIDIADEIAKDELSALRIDRSATDKTGVTHITLKSLDQWARKEHNISIIEPSELLPSVTGEQQGPPPTGIDTGMDRKQSRQSRTRLLDQGKAILKVIAGLGYDPKRLPKNMAGRPGVKAEVKNALNGHGLFSAATAFEKAWERLRKDGDIANVK